MCEAATHMIRERDRPDFTELMLHNSLVSSHIPSSRNSATLIGPIAHRVLLPRQLRPNGVLGDALQLRP